MSLYDSILREIDVRGKRKIDLISQIIAFSFIAEILITKNLWIPLDREFPLISAFESLPLHLGFVVNLLLFAVLIGSLVLIAYRKWVKTATIAIVSAFALFILEDITRLQPWIYTQSFILILLSLDHKKKSKAVLFGILVILSSTYVWSGIQKMNIGFITNVIPWYLSEPFGFDLYLEIKTAIPSSYYGFFIIPLIEILIGVLLLFNKTRKKAVAFALIMHLLLLFFLGPFGHSWNSVVWIWNISLILLLVAIHRDDISFQKSHFSHLRLNYFVFGLFFIMPIFNFIGLWDSNLSGILYSGTIPKMTYQSTSEEEFSKKRKKATFINKKDPKAGEIPKTHVLYWAYHDVNVFGYAEPRYFKRLAKIMCQASGNKSDVIDIITKEKFTAKEKSESCTCEELLKEN